MIEEGEDYQFEQELNDGLDNAGLSLLEFLAPRRKEHQASPVPTCALLSGPAQCGKTSLLLQLAYNLASDARARVVFLCKPQNFDDDHIYLSPEMDTTGEVSERVHIKYINSDEELRKYFAAFHLHLELPTAVIVDDFVEYFDQSCSEIGGKGELPLAKALCLCHNAIEYANEKGKSGLQCRLVISDTHLGHGPRLLYIFKRWISQVFEIKALVDHPSTFTLELQDMNGERGNRMGRYRLVNHTLYFDGLEIYSEPIVKSCEPISIDISS